EGLLEERPARGERIERRGEGVPITVAAEVVGAGGVERDEEDVGGRGLDEPTPEDPYGRPESQEGGEDGDPLSHFRVSGSSPGSHAGDGAGGCPAARHPVRPGACATTGLAQYSVPVGKVALCGACQSLAARLERESPPLIELYLKPAVLF